MIAHLCRVYTYYLYPDTSCSSGILVSGYIMSDVNAALRYVTRSFTAGPFYGWLG